MSVQIETTGYRRILTTFPSDNRVTASSVDGRIAITCSTYDPDRGAPLDFVAVLDATSSHDRRQVIWIGWDESSCVVEGTEDMDCWRLSGRFLPAVLLPWAAALRPLIEATHEAEGIRLRAEQAATRSRRRMPRPSIGSLAVPPLANSDRDQVHALVDALNGL